jgi:hypothetical protein
LQTQVLGSDRWDLLTPLVARIGTAVAGAVLNQPGQIVHESLSQKFPTHKKRTGEMAPAVERLPSKQNHTHKKRMAAEEAVLLPYRSQDTIPYFFFSFFFFWC